MTIEDAKKLPPGARLIWYARDDGPYAGSHDCSCTLLGTTAKRVRVTSATVVNTGWRAFDSERDPVHIVNPDRLRLDRESKHGIEINGRLGLLQSKNALTRATKRSD